MTLLILQLFYQEWTRCPSAEDCEQTCDGAYKTLGFCAASAIQMYEIALADVQI